MIALRTYYLCVLLEWIVEVNMDNIQALSDQAKKLVPQGILSPDKWIEKYNEEFARLVIEDCMRILDKNGYNDAAKHLHDVHFGIDDAV